METSNTTPPAITARAAAHADDPLLRALLRNNPMPGRFSLALTREPDFFLGSTIEGEEHQTFLARDPDTDEPVALGSRSVAKVYLNGEVRRLGYLSQLRVERAFRGSRRGTLKAIFNEAHKYHVDDNVPFYTTTIVEGNAPALRALTSGVPGLPTYTPWGVLSTLALPMWRARRVPTAGISIHPGSTEQLDAIATFLQHRNRNYQFAPYWTADDLNCCERTRDLQPEDFLVARRGAQIVGCLATWNQLAYKQTVVHDYAGALRYVRPLVNLTAPLIGVPRLPARGGLLKHAYLSHLAADDPQVLCTLVAEALCRAQGNDYAYLTLALAEGNPLLAALKNMFRYLEYRSIVYLVHWEDGSKVLTDIDHRVAHLELATL